MDRCFIVLCTHVDHFSKVSKGVSAVDCLIGTVVVSTTICHDCFTVSIYLLSVHKTFIHFPQPLQIKELCLDLSLPMSHHSMPQVCVSVVISSA